MAISPTALTNIEGRQEDERFRRREHYEHVERLAAIRASSPSYDLTWVYVALGVVLGAGIVGYLMWQKRNSETDSVDRFVEPPDKFLTLGAAKPKQLPPSIMTTIQVQSFASNSPSLLAEAFRDNTVAEVRVVGPAGAYATLAFDPAALFNTTSAPVGRTFTLPAGQRQQIRLSLGQKLYAAGDVDDVLISVAVR